MFGECSCAKFVEYNINHLYPWKRILSFGFSPLSKEKGGREGEREGRKEGRREGRERGWKRGRKEGREGAWEG